MARRNAGVPAALRLRRGARALLVTLVQLREPLAACDPAALVTRMGGEVTRRHRGQRPAPDTDASSAAVTLSGAVTTAGDKAGMLRRELGVAVVYRLPRVTLPARDAAVREFRAS